MSRSTPVADRPGRVRARLPLPGWAGRSDVEQVDLYTRGSLYAIAWFLIAASTLGTVVRLESTRAGGVVVLAALVAGVLTTLVVRDGLRRRMAGAATWPTPWWPLAGLVGLSVGLAVWGAVLVRSDRTDGVQLAFSLALLGTASAGWAAGAVSDRRLHLGAVVLGGVLMLVATGEPFLAVYGAAVVAFFVFTTMSSLWLLRIVTELDQARGSQAALAVAEERLRFSRDVHDVLGRQLSVIAVQAELAATLARRGDERTAEKILQVRATAHDALREARELARGYRPLALDQELDGAVSLLRSAGIAAYADLDGLPEAWHEPVARLVREAVTNVLRHSSARVVRISWDGAALLVADDGDGPAREPVAGGGGAGLRGLTERLEPLGARLASGPGQDGGFVVSMVTEPAAPGRAPTRTEEPA